MKKKEEEVKWSSGTRLTIKEKGIRSQTKGAVRSVKRKQRSRELVKRASQVDDTILNAKEKEGGILKL
jgi:hypothetical protein